jgi:hypothetical protein
MCCLVSLLQSSGYFTYHQLFTFCTHSAFVCFVWISEIEIMSLRGIKRLVFVSETDCVYCAVRTGSLNVIQVKISL